MIDLHNHFKREFMHGKLKGVEDSEIIRTHIQNELKALEDKINQQ